MTILRIIIAPPVNYWWYMYYMIPSVELICRYSVNLQFLSSFHFLLATPLFTWTGKGVMLPWLEIENPTLSSISIRWRSLMTLCKVIYLHLRNDYTMVFCNWQYFQTYFIIFFCQKLLINAYIRHNLLINSLPLTGIYHKVLLIYSFIWQYEYSHGLSCMWKILYDCGAFNLLVNCMYFTFLKVLWLGGILLYD